MYMYQQEKKKQDTKYELETKYMLKFTYLECALTESERYDILKRIGEQEDVKHMLNKGLRNRKKKKRKEKNAGLRCNISLPKWR